VLRKAGYNISGWKKARKGDGHWVGGREKSRASHPAFLMYGAKAPAQEARFTRAP